MRISAQSYIERADGKFLTVRNRKHHDWSLPGGKAESGEHHADTAERELKQETGLDTDWAKLVYGGRHRPDAMPPSGRYIYVYVVKPSEMPSEAEQEEAGGPIKWMTWPELLSQTRFRPFYERVRTAIELYKNGKAGI